MGNLIGDDAPTTGRTILSDPANHLHLYGKAAARAGAQDGPCHAADAGVSGREIFLVVARADNGVIGARRRDALAHPGRPQAVQGADHGQADGHGPQDLRELARPAPRPPPYRADPRSATGRPTARKCAHSVDEALALAGDGDVAVIGGAEIYRAVPAASPTGSN